MQGLVHTPEISVQEKQIVEELLASTLQLAAVIPDNVEASVLWDTLSASCKAMTTYRSRIGVLKPLIGRALIVLRDNPDIYRAQGCRTFDNFMTQVLPEKLGVPRSEGYEAIRLVENWPSLTVADCQRVKYNKLRLISQFTKESSPDANRYLELAQSHTFDQLKDICANNGVLPKEESELATISILTNLGRKTLWNEFINDPQVQAFVGTSDPGTILEMAIADARASWNTHEMLEMQEQDETWAPVLAK